MGHSQDRAAGLDFWLKPEMGNQCQVALCVENGQWAPLFRGQRSQRLSAPSAPPAPASEKPEKPRLAGKSAQRETKPTYFMLCFQKLVACACLSQYQPRSLGSKDDSSLHKSG